MKVIIANTKFHGCYLILQELGEIMGQVFKTIISEVDYLVPVPLHWQRRWWRGYNQAELLARAIERGKVLDCLIRIKNTKQQAKLTKAERAINTDKAFGFKQGFNISNRNILLVDDVFTTGSTVAACTSILVEQGVKSVHVLTFARDL